MPSEQPGPEERNHPTGRRNLEGIRIDPVVEAEHVSPPQSVISALVEDEPGVLARVSGLVSRRQFNIESLTVGPTTVEGHSRITMVVEETDPGIDQIEKQMAKLKPVISVGEVSGDAVTSELVLLKVQADDPAAVHAVSEMYDGRTVDAGPETITVELTGDNASIDNAIGAFERFGIVEIARTGPTAPRAATRRRRPERNPERPANRRLTTTDTRIHTIHMTEDDTQTFNSTVYYDEDADGEAIAHKTVAVLGYGSQGHAHAQNLNDSGVDVVVGLREDSSSWDAAESDGLRVEVPRGGRGRRGRHRRQRARARHGPAGRVRERHRAEPGRGRHAPVRARVQHPLQPDPAARGRRRDDGRTEVAGPPRPPQLRERRGDARLLAVYQDATGDAHDEGLAYAAAIGCTRAGVVETSFPRGDRDRPVRRAGRPLWRRHLPREAGVRDARRRRLPRRWRTSSVSTS